MSAMDLKFIIEAIIFASEEPLALGRLKQILAENFNVDKSELKASLESLQSDYKDRGVELVETAGGFSFKTKGIYNEYVGSLWNDRKPRYTRAFLETMAIIAYRQPVTRGEIEEIRGVAASTGIVRQLLDREWIKPVGKKEVPGRPTMYGTTDTFLDYFGLRSLNELPAFEIEETGSFGNLSAQGNGGLNLETPTAVDERPSTQGIAKI